MTAPDSAFAPRPLAARPRRLGPLIRFYDGCLRRRLGAQVGKLLAVLVATGHAIALPFAARAASGDAGDAVVVNALGWLTWLGAGAIALSAVGRGSDEAPARDLASARGFSKRAMRAAELLASGRRTLRVVGGPAVLLAAFALGLSRSVPTLTARGLLLLGVLAYVSLIAALVAALVRLSRALGPHRPRSALLALVVLPHLLHELFPRVPSVPALTSFLTAQLLGIGAFFR